MKKVHKNLLLLCSALVFLNGNVVFGSQRTYISEQEALLSNPKLRLSREMELLKNASKAERDRFSRSSQKDEIIDQIIKLTPKEYKAFKDLVTLKERLDFLRDKTQRVNESQYRRQSSFSYDSGEAIGKRKVGTYDLDEQSFRKPSLARTKSFEIQDTTQRNMKGAGRVYRATCKFDLSDPNNVKITCGEAEAVPEVEKEEIDHRNSYSDKSTTAGLNSPHYGTGQFQQGSQMTFGTQSNNHGQPMYTEVPQSKTQDSSSFYQEQQQRQAQQVQQSVQQPVQQQVQQPVQQVQQPVQPTRRIR